MNNETLMERLQETTAPPSVVNGVRDIIRNEQALKKQCDEYAADLKESQTAVIALRAENERLAAALRQIGQAVTPAAFNSQLENWILAQVDGVLGDE